jgi:hypothetical protein
LDDGRKDNATIGFGMASPKRCPDPQRPCRGCPENPRGDRQRALEVYCLRRQAAKVIEREAAKQR